MPTIRMTFERNGMDPRDYGVRAEQLLAAAVKKAAFDVEAAAKLSIMTGDKTGRIYRAEQEVSFTTAGGEQVEFTAYAGKSGHQASAPGEAPATDLGNLVNSIMTEQEGPLAWRVWAHALYAAMLEFGTTRMAARPYMMPAVEKVRPAFLAACADALRGAKRGI